jgi:D-alanine---(R)-lactate ligase
MDRLKVGIVFGGACEEHPISIKSAQEVAKNLDTEKYEPFWIGITTNGVWKLCDGPHAGWESGSSRTAMLSPDRNVHGLLVQQDGAYETVRLDLVFPVLHGRFGEDGAIQGLLELSGIPYVGCDVQSSALCMDKSLAYTVASNAGIATPAFSVVTGNERVDPALLAYPAFVKPARSGSSFGVSKVTQDDELPKALKTARQYDTKVLIEEAVDGSEIGCAILGERFGLVAGEVDRVALSHGFFRIHQEESPETGSENSNFVVPADIPEDSRRLVAMTLHGKRR